VSFLLDTHVWIWTQEQPDSIVTADERILAYRSVRTLDVRG
jgi:PIN domain nuclease of toxin-antitoxin system